MREQQSMRVLYCSGLRRSSYSTPIELRAPENDNKSRPELDFWSVSPVSGWNESESDGSREQGACAAERGVFSVSTQHQSCDIGRPRRQKQPTAHVRESALQEAQPPPLTTTTTTTTDSNNDRDALRSPPITTNTRLHRPPCTCSAHTLLSSRSRPCFRNVSDA